jgi:uncharacterized membrane protein YgcG
MWVSSGKLGGAGSKLVVCAYVFAGQELHQQLDKVLEAHRAAAEAIVQQELDSCCNTALGNTCSGSGSDSTDSSDSGELCKDTEECKFNTLCEGSGTCSSDDSSSSSAGSQEQGTEAQDIEASHKEADGGGDRQGSSDSSSSDGDGSGSAEGDGGTSSRLLKALKKRVGLGSGDAHNSSRDPEMKVHWL